MALRSSPEDERALEHAVAELDPLALAPSLDRVLRALVIAVSVDIALFWVRDTDEDGRMHLLAAEGMSTREKTRVAGEPLSMATVRSLVALGPHHSVARLLGLRWVGGVWLTTDEVLGALVVGARTDRRPDEDGNALLQSLATAIAKPIADADRSDPFLRTVTRRMVAQWVESEPALGDGPLSVLRPRERTVLGLYAEGLGADDIARLLVVSPHTVRTHIKNAFRRLGVHSREEATALVRADELGRLV